jgi:acetyl/propionyl-CoA carboxylase alpha subunit
VQAAMSKIKKELIAYRGEISKRIIKTCRTMRTAVVAICSNNVRGCHTASWPGMV